MKRLPLITLALYMLTACSAPTTIDTQGEAQKLMQASRDWAIAAKERNIDKVLGYWQDDAVMFSPSQPILKGKQAISEMVKASYADSSFSISWEPVSAEISNDGSMGYIIEKSTISFKDSTGFVTHKLNAVSIWKKQTDGSWRNVVDMTTPE
jgi:ketosteroid isomerase-like protein